MFNSRLNLLVNSGKYFKIPIIPIPLQPWHFALFSPKGQTEGCENMFPIIKSTHMENMRTEVRESREWGEFIYIGTINGILTWIYCSCLHQIPRSNCSSSSQQQDNQHQSKSKMAIMQTTYVFVFGSGMFSAITDLQTH